MTSPAVDFVLPASFQPVEMLPGRLAVRADDARWVVNTIVRKMANRDTDVWGLVRLHTDVLRRVMYSHDSADVIAALVEGGAIETVGYSVGRTSRGFRLAARYLADRCVRVRAVDPRLIDRIQRERERQKQSEQAERWKPIHHQLNVLQAHISITPEAGDILDTLPDHSRLCQSVLVDNLRRGERPFSVSKTGRVFNSITGLKRELREAVRIDGRHVSSVDVRCAQPALLAMMIGARHPPNGTNQRPTYKHAAGACPSLPLPVHEDLQPAGSDLVRFCKVASDGSLYDVLAALVGSDRAYVKRRFLVDVLAKRGRYPSDVDTAFREGFPTVHSIIRAVNVHDHGELIRRLQRAESWLVVENVAPKLVAAGLVFATLHDAVYSPRAELITVERAFVEVLGSLGAKLTLKREA